MTLIPLGANDPPDAAALKKPGAAKAWDAAQKFEAQAIGALLTPMFDTMDQTGGEFGGGSAEATWRPMLTEQMGNQLGKGGELELAVPVFRQLMRLQETGDGS